MRWKWLLTVLLLAFNTQLIACLDAVVELKCTPCSVEKALEQLDAQVDCSFSYNPSQFNLDELINGSYSGIDLEEALKAILGNSLEVSKRGRHLLLESDQSSKKTGGKQKYIIEGIIKNARTGQVIQRATVYTVGDHYSALSDENGYYRIELASPKEQLGISYSKQSYFDTILIVQPAEEGFRQNVSLSPRDQPLERMNPRTVTIPEDREEVEMLPMVRFLVPETQRSRAINLDFIEEIPLQFSLLPSIGTNRLTSGHSENRFSVNLIAGYNAGLQGLEAGSGVNIIRQDAKGVQTAGIGNIVGGEVSGVQAAGIFNNVRGTVKGLQAAGVYNIVLDTMKGVQASGVFNVLQGKISGAQFGGVFNLASEDMEGLQAAGVFNITRGEVIYAQTAGLFNTAGSVTGGQIAGFLNASGDVKGSQVSGFMNTGGNVSGIQIGGFLNAARDASFQISGFMNFAKTVTGAQVGVINFADSAATAIGLFSYSKKGYHHLDVYADEVHYANVAFRTGTAGFHNIVKAGFGSYYGITLMSYGYGLGTTIPTKSERIDLNVEASGRQIFHLENLEHPMNLDLAADVNFAIKTGPVRILLGPSLHLLIRNGQIQNLDPENGPILEIQNGFPLIFDLHKGTVSYNLWPGFRLGIRV